MHCSDSSHPDLERIFPGDSEMAGRMRAIDWTSSTLGPPENWPQALRVAIGICLGSRFPLHVWWGPSLTLFYNDAYIPFLGTSKHPAALGRSGREAWAELWDQIGPMIEAVFATGVASWSEDILMFFNRDLPKEEVYATFSFSPVFGEQGAVEGMFCACTETTEKLIGARRLDTLRRLGVEASIAGSADEACRSAGEILAGNPQDVPFVAIYLIDEAGTGASLVASTGFSAGTWQAPDFVSLDEPNPPDGLPLGSIFRTRRAAEITDAPARGMVLPGGAWDEPAQRLVVLPIHAAAPDEPAGLLVAGVSARRPFDAAYRTFFDHVAGHIGTAIADARAYEAERRRAEALAELDRAKTTFFSNISHEFRTPLTLMLGPLEDEMRAHPATAERLELVHRNGRRLLRLVNTLLDFASVEAGRMEAAYEATDLAAYTAELASIFRSAIEKAGLRLSVDCPPLPQTVFVDRGMWEKIVLNLLSNACKFTFEGEIRVALRCCDERVELTVTDTGVGIAEAQTARVFDRFYRSRDSRSRTHEGTGIGLALVRELARLHGGDVSVESALGQGSRFVVAIPTGSEHLPQEGLGKAPQQADVAAGAMPFVDEAMGWLGGDDGPLSGACAGAAAPATPGAARDPAACVLLADDNADMRVYLRRLLAERYEVIAVADGEAALAAIAELGDRLPDLVLTDVMMPRLDGFGLLRELRAEPRTQTLPVILLSARAGEEACFEGLAEGADDYLVKPFSARELLARVDTHLELARIRKTAEAALRRSNEDLEQAVGERTRMLAATNAALEREADERRRVEASLRDSEAKLAAELDDMKQLQRISSQLIHEDNTDALYAQILDAAIALMRSDMASMQIYDAEQGALQLQASKGFHPASAAFWQCVRDDSASSCSEALRRGERVIVPDTETCGFIAGSQDLDHVRLSGIRAMQSTPLVSRRGRFVGMLSTHWREPHHAAARELALFDMLARQVADLFERKQAVIALASLNERLEGLVAQRTAALAGSEERFRALVSASSQIVWTTDANGEVVEDSPSWREFTGQTFAEWIGNGGVNAVHPEDRAAVAELWQRAVAARAPVDTELRLRHVATDSWRWIAVRAVPLFEEAGGVRGWVGMCTDIEVRKRAEEQLRRMASELTMVEQEERRRISQILHDDLQQQLYMVRMQMAQLMRDAGTSDVERLKANTSELYAQIGEAITVTRRLSVDLSPPVLQGEGLGDALRWLASQMEQMHGISIGVDAPDAFVITDANMRGLLFQIARELLFNVVKHAGADQAQIELRQVAEEIVMRVIDAGCGFDVEEAKRRNDRGLGLLNAHDRLGLFGGSIEIESHPGAGTRVVVRLPAAHLKKMGDEEK